MAKSQIRNIVDIVLQLGVLGLMLAWCFQILGPFINPVLWGMIIAVALDPVYQWIHKRTGRKAGLTSFILTVILVAIVAVPSYFVFKSAFVGLKEIKTMYENDEIKVGQPSESIKEWPLIGERSYDFWMKASKDFEGIVIQYQEEIVEGAKYIFSALAGSGAGILGVILSLIIAGVLLATKGTRDAANSIFSRLAGSFGLEFARITEQTIQSVVKGVLGVAVIQAGLIGIGMFIAGVPFAGLWTLLVLILAIVQLPATIVVIPVIIYLFNSGDTSTGMAIFWTVYLLAAGISDNVLKPILLGKGAAVPMLVIFLGAIGGFMAFGFIGLFVGAIVLSIMYRLFITWLESEENQTDNKLASE